MHSLRNRRERPQGAAADRLVTASNLLPLTPEKQLSPDSLHRRRISQRLAFCSGDGTARALC
jgi:hypothetical protein